MLVVSADTAVSVGVVCVHTVLIAESTMQFFFSFFLRLPVCVLACQCRVNVVHLVTAS
jgi:hypothetical protein